MYWIVPAASVMRSSGKSRAEKEEAGRSQSGRGPGTSGGLAVRACLAVLVYSLGWKGVIPLSLSLFPL